jgi:ribonucleotide reductase beta subunit family protein with ferritin-like domain
MLNANDQRYTLYPILHDDIFAAYKTQLACFWVADEIDYSKDREQFDALTPEEQHFIKCILSFFAATDAVVSLNIMDNFCAAVPLLEAQICYTYQAMMENIHSEAYSMMIDAYVSDPIEKRKLLRDVSAMPSVNRKMQWALRLKQDDKATLAERLVGFVIVEGVFFSSAFASIFWFKQRNLLPALTKSNTLIARDEGQHCNFGALIYSKLDGRLPQARVHQMFEEAVDIEHQFVDETITANYLGMNATLMRQYVQVVADQMLGLLGYEPLYRSTNPFEFMELLGMDARDNFFETVPAQYQRGAVLNEARDIDHVTDNF